MTASTSAGLQPDLIDTRNFASFEHDGGEPSWGLVAGEEIIDLGPSGAQLAPDLKAAIAEGLLDAEIPEPGRHVSLETVRLLPPIPNPGKILCVGVNYKSHQDEASHRPSAPTIFIRFADSQIGHGEAACKPASTEQFDYEGELALVIGREAWHVPETSAIDVIAGYSIYNDFSVRDWQRAASQWTPGKNFPRTGAFGPYLVPASAAPDITEARLETRVNGEVRQSAKVADLVFGIPELIAYITGFTRLRPGDVIVTGTPGGVGLFMKPPQLLSVGDVVEVEIDGIGLLANSVAAEG